MPLAGHRHMLLGSGINAARKKANLHKIKYLQLSYKKSRAHISNVKLNNIGSANCTSFHPNDICENSTEKLICCRHNKFSFQNQKYHFCNLYHLSLKKHFKGLRIVAIFLPKFLEFLATCCLPCLVLNSFALTNL